MESERTVENSVTGGACSNDDQKDYDLLAYFADFTNCSGNMAQNAEQRLLMSILVDDTKHYFPNQSNSGAASQVFVMRSADFIEPVLGDAQVGLFPEVIAVKRRMFKGSRNSIKDWQPLKSLSTEMRVLTDSNIRAHPNIVSFLGNCWHYADEERTLILPMMILEATRLGDLQTYHDQNPDLTLGRQLQLGLGITRGVVALHEAGIIHCDLKPKNVLVFSQDDKNCPIVPKIIDFDLAILYQDCPDRVLPPQGTKVWNSPEQADDRVALPKDDLLKIDTFALGMVLLNLLTSNFLSKHISALETPHFQKLTGGLNIEQVKRTGTLAVNVMGFLKDFANISGPEGDNAEFSGFRKLWMRATKILTRALDMNLNTRCGSAVEIEHEIQRICQDVEDAGLADYYNKEVALTTERQGGISILINNVTEPGTLEKIIALSDAFLTACHPRIIEYAQMIGISVEQMSNMIYASEGGFKLDSVLGEIERVELPNIPGRRLQSSRFDVVKISYNLGTFSSLPEGLISRILVSLKDVYSSPRQPKDRRATAAFEHAIASIGLYISEGQSPEDTIDEALEMLRFAAENGQEHAQCLTRWMERTFKPSEPRSEIHPSELEWLKKGVLEGSRIARIQLQECNRAVYSEALHQVRTKGRGMGGTTWKNIELRSYQRFSPHSIWHYASAGNSLELREVLSLMKQTDESMLQECINTPIFEDRATPLLEACRSGHSEAAHLLLEYGADASLKDYDQVGPLHFLSSFEPAEMLSIASALIDHGCEIDGWTSDVNYSDIGTVGLDRLYGLANGTPLLWAVAANCMEAVDVLLSLGADPFARNRPSFLQSANGQYSYPVLWAAQSHQTDMLTCLLRDIPKEDIASLLDSHWIVVEKGVGRIGPLGIACLYGGGRVLSRILIHGSRHIEQCSKTIHMLLDLGAGSERVASFPREEQHIETEAQRYSSALQIASQVGQPYALHALLQWKGGVLQPEFQQWLSLLVTTANHGNRTCFSELLKLSIQLEPPFTWIHVISEIAKRTQEKYYLHAVISKHQDTDPKPADYTIPFGHALQEGYIENARIIYERADKVDVSRVYTVDDDQQKYTLLGILIFRAKRHQNRIPAVEAFLDIVGARDDIFDGVLQMRGNRERINALQFAIFYAFDSPHISIGTDLLAALLRRFHHPVKHLGSRFDSNDNSLLHEAVRSGNYAALNILLTVNGVNFDVRNFTNLTPFDYCIIRYQDSTRDSDSTVRDAINAGKGEAWAHEQWEHATNLMIRSMERKGASRYGDISHVFKRLSPSRILYIVISSDGEINEEIIDPQDFITRLPAMEGRQDLVDAVANLAIGKCFYLKMK